MGYDLWEEGELMSLAKQSLLAKLASTLDIDLSRWLESAISVLPETLRVTKARSDRDWTVNELRKMGGKPIPWMPNESAWQMPFARGKAPDDYAKRMMTILHDSGRITRQEAASMLPVELLGITEETVVLDMCAAPGSKTTQIAEKLSTHGFVIANEPVSSRANMLISNRARLALTNVLINQQVGRHIGRIPEPGYDAIIADVPCSGSATTRKNVKVWEKWRPLDGRSLFSLQVNIAESGARGLRPGGKMLYSTCSIDPGENEAVVAELLRNCPWMELVEINEEILPGLIMHDGLSAWDVIDDEGKPVEINETLPKLPGLKLTHIDPQKRQMIDENVDEGNENYIAEQLKLTKRLYHMDNDTGGFFVALLRHKPEATPEGKAKVYIPKRKLVQDSGWEPRIIDVKAGGRHAVIPAHDEEISQVIEQYKLNTNGLSWWKRGRRLNITPESVYDRLYHPMCPNKDGNFWQNDTFHPLKIIHAGMPCFVNNKGTWRTRQEAIPAIEKILGDVIIEIDAATVIALLNDEAILKEDLLPSDIKEYSGPLILGCDISNHQVLISAWSGNWISLMIGTTEKDIVRAKLQLPFEHELEEE